MLKVCLQCEKEFKTYRTAAIYCCKSCADAAQVKAKTYTCTQCGKEFQRPNYRMRTNTQRKHFFCTPDCMQQWRKANQRPDIPCVVCGEMFHPKSEAIKHCSKECRDKSQFRQVELICEQCHKPFMAFPSEYMDGRKFCSHECSEQYHAGIKHPNYRGGKWFMHGTRWKKIRKKIIERDKVCRWCGTATNPSGRALSVHHIYGRRNYLIVDMAHEEKNLVTLCDSCHTKVEQAITHGRTSQLPKWLRPQQ